MKYFFHGNPTKPEPDPTGDPSSGFLCAREIAGRPALMGHSLPVARDQKRVKIAKTRKIQSSLLDSTAYDGYHINKCVCFCPAAHAAAQCADCKRNPAALQYSAAGASKALPTHKRQTDGFLLTVYERITTTYRETVETAFPIPYHSPPLLFDCAVTPVTIISQRSADVKHNFQKAILRLTIAI